MSSAPVTLVVGSEGLIGSALLAQLRMAGLPVAATTMFHELVEEGRLYLDLSKDVQEWRCPFSVRVAILCAAITSLEACRKDPLKTALINVRNLVQLARNLVQQGAFVVFLSSNQVFDGSVPRREPGDSFSPITEYGRQKAQTEQEIARFGNAAAIVRFTKVLGPDQLLLGEWTRKLKRGETINPFSDMYFAPVPLSSALSVLRLVADQRLSGIWQVSAPLDVSYADAALLGAELLGVSRDLVHPVSAREKLSLPEPIPMNTTLSISGIRSALGIEPPDVRWTIQTAFLDPKTLAGLYQNEGLSSKLPR